MIVHDHALRTLFMVFVLIIYIIDQSIFLFKIIRECSVTHLPTFKIRKLPGIGHPIISGQLDIFYKICQANCRLQIRKNVNVVFDAIDGIGKAIFIFDVTMNIPEQFCRMGFGNDRLTVLGTKYNLVINLFETTGAFQIVAGWWGHQPRATRRGRCLSRPLTT